MPETTGFKFQGTGKLSRVEKFTSKAGKTMLTLIFEEGGQYPQMIPIKVFGRLAEMASEWKPGGILEVSGKIGGREWNGKVYGDAVAQTVEVVAEGKPKASGQQTEFADGSPPSADYDVPF